MSIADKLTTIAENVPKVFEAGYAKGKSESGDNYYDTFWDAFQQNGNLKDYSAAFAGIGWNEKTFRPKYDIVPITATQMFARGSFGGDVEEHLSKLGRKLDFSKCNAIVETFFYTGVTRIGILDTTACSSLTTLLSNSRAELKTIDLLILKDNGSQTFGNNSFLQSTGLTNITIQGKIGTSINLQWSTKLTAQSIASIVEALCPASTTSGLTLTLSRTAVNNADWSTTDYADFEALEATKTNWTITLL